MPPVCCDARRRSPGRQRSVSLHHPLPHLHMSKSSGGISSRRLPLFKVPPRLQRRRKKWAPRNKGNVLMMLFEFGLIFPFPLSRASHNNSVCCAIQDTGVEGGEKLPVITNSRAEARRVRGPGVSISAVSHAKPTGHPKNCKFDF